VRGYGVPDRQYDLEKTTDNWSSWSTVSGSPFTAAANGILIGTDTAATSDSAMYRFKVH
jgi:hypothetical protein